MSESASSPRETWVLKTKFDLEGGAFELQVAITRPKNPVTADGAGVLSHAGTRLLPDLRDGRR